MIGKHPSKYAEEARIVEEWAHKEERDTPWWRLARRRYLQGVREEMTANRAKFKKMAEEIE